MTARPRILVTRKITDPAEARLEALFDARFNPKDRTYSGDELVALAEGRDGLLVAAGDPLNAKVIGALPDTATRLPQALMIGRGTPEPTGDDRTFWVTDSPLPETRLVEVLGLNGLAAAPLIATGGLKLMMIAGYVQADDGRLDGLPGTLTGVIGAAPLF